MENENTCTHTENTFQFNRIDKTITALSYRQLSGVVLQRLLGGGAAAVGTSFDDCIAEYGIFRITQYNNYIIADCGMRDCQYLCIIGGSSSSISMWTVRVGLRQSNAKSIETQFRSRMFSLVSRCILYRAMLPCMNR